MKITIKESVIVHPAEETPKESLWSSNFDLLVGRAHVPSVYFYRPDDARSSNFFDTQVLKEALSKVLVPFYPAAGRLRRRDGDGRIEVQCNAEGVLFIEAETDWAIDNFGDFAPSFETRQLAPTVDYSGDISSYPLLLLQVTTFKCGGVSLGVCFHHTLADGTSALHLINSWSDIARGVAIKTSPFFDRTLLKARQPPNLTFNHIEYGPSPTMDNDDPGQKPKPTSAKILKITVDQLNTLKTKFWKYDATTRFSTFEVLAAHIWRCTNKARSLSNDQTIKLYMATDGRSRLQPPLPSGYFGNVLIQTAIVCSSGEIQSESLLQTMERIHGALKKMDDAYLRSALDYLQMHSDLKGLTRGAHTFKCPNLHVVSWTRLPIHEADFGWGRPIFMGRASISEGTAYITRSSVLDDGSLSLGICLETPHMQLFEKLFYDF